MKEIKFEVDISDFKRLEQSINRLGKLPQKVVNKAAGKGVTVAGRAIRAAAPTGKTGQLKKGFKRMPEKSRAPGEKVYRYGMDPDKNKIFQKTPKNPRALGGKNDKAYYPASVEYGFIARGPNNGVSYLHEQYGFLSRKNGRIVYHSTQKVPGQHFVKRAAESAEPAVKKAMIDTMVAELEKEWAKK